VVSSGGGGRGGGRVRAWWERGWVHCVGGRAESRVSARERASSLTLSLVSHAPAPVPTTTAP
jgi:hypothetical protein